MSESILKNALHQPIAAGADGAHIASTTSAATDTKNVRSARSGTTRSDVDVNITRDDFSQDSNSNSKLNFKLRAGVDLSNTTNILSDHFPVYAEWEDHTFATIDLF